MNINNINRTEMLRCLVGASVIAVFAIFTTKLYAYGHNQLCKGKPTEYLGECKVEYSGSEGGCLYSCPGSKARTTYTGVGSCDYNYGSDCSKSTVDGKYTEAEGECVPPSSCNGTCYVPSWGPEGDEQTSGNPECNPPS